MSEPTKEPRCDAKLKNLPEDRQQEIIEKLKADGFVKTRAWLREDGINTSFGALSEFRSWYLLKQQYQRRESRVLQLMEMRKQKQPGISELELFEYGQEVFSTLALEDEDRKSWVSVQQLTMSKNLEEAKIQIRKQAEERMREKLQLEQKKARRQSIEQFIEWYNDKRVKEIVTSDEPKPDMTEKLGQLIFKEDW